MTSWIDEKYVQLISSKLPLFKKKSSGLYNFRCPFCGDSQKNKFKCRGYLYTKNGQMFYDCKNCGMGTTLGKVLEFLDKTLADQYTADRYLEKNGGRKRTVGKVRQLPIFNTKDEIYLRAQKRLIDALLDRLDTLPEDNIAVKEVIKRKIPRDKWYRLYYIDNIKKLEQLDDKYKDKITSEEPRIVIPFFDRQHRLFGMTCRDLIGLSKLKYVTVMLNEHPQIFGLDEYDPSVHGYVVEGPLDSLFLPNAMAASGTALKVIKRFPYIKDYTVVYDNQPRNKDVAKLTRAAVIRGEQVMIWPDIEVKDLNDAHLAGYNVKELVDSNTYQGPEALLRWSEWNKTTIAA